MSVRYSVFDWQKQPEESCTAQTCALFLLPTLNSTVICEIVAEDMAGIVISNFTQTLTQV